MSDFKEELEHMHQLEENDKDWVNEQVKQGRIEARYKSLLLEFVHNRRELQHTFTELREKSLAKAQGDKSVPIEGILEFLDRRILRLLQVTANNYQTSPRENIDLRLCIDNVWSLASERVTLFPEQMKVVALGGFPDSH